QDQAAQPDQVPGRGRQDQGHPALPRTGNGAPGVRRAADRAGKAGPRAACGGGAVPEDGGPPAHHGAGAEEGQEGSEKTGQEGSEEGSERIEGTETGSFRVRGSRSPEEVVPRFAKCSAGATRRHVKTGVVQCPR